MPTTATDGGVIFRPISYTCGPCGRVVEQCTCNYIAALKRLREMYLNGGVGLGEFVQRGSYILGQAMDAAPEDMQGMVETTNARTME